MTILPHRRYRLLILMMSIAGLLMATLVSTPPAGATQKATWAAWAITVDFPQQTPHVIYTAYVGTNDPTPTVLDWRHTDISNQCIIRGSLSYQGDYAIFDGKSYIECRVPEWRTEVAAMAPYLPMADSTECDCKAGGAPFFAAADVRLPSDRPGNPIFDAKRLGVTMSLPTNNGQGRTKVELSSGTYTSPAWAVQTTGNRMLMGQNGPAIVAVDSHFGWLNFLADPNWDNFFTASVVGATMGHWVETPSASWTTPAAPYQLKTHSDIVFIGHSPTNGTYLRGELRKGVLDPGCRTT